jgi:hypothetical protein
MESLGFTLQKEAELETLTVEVVKSSEIEGEKLKMQLSGAHQLPVASVSRRLAGFRPFVTAKSSFGSNCDPTRAGVATKVWPPFWPTL